HYMLTNAPGAESLANAGTTDAMFALINMLPLSGTVIWLLSLLAVVVVAIFFATSSDSGSLVVDMLTNGGDPHPVWQQRLFWALLEGVVAAVLLVAGAASGGDALTALQSASIITGLPFSIVLCFMAYGLMVQLRKDTIPAHPAIKAKPAPADPAKPKAAAQPAE
ncbi:BCCT family transporter, partial [Thioclava sp. BHET1]